MLRDMLPRPLLKMDLRKESFALLPKRFFVFHLKPFVFSFFLSFFSVCFSFQKGLGSCCCCSTRLIKCLIELSIYT